MFAASDRNLLELTQISVKSNRLARLSDLAHWATTEKTIELLIQLAKHHKLISIAEEIETIKLQMFRKTNVSANMYPNVQASVPVVTTTLPRINPDITMVSESPVASLASTWITPKLPEMVAKESPSGILANLTPMKSGPATVNNETTVSSPAELAGTPSATSNPFAKPTNENRNPETLVNDGNAMLDYISTMMKLNGNSNNNNNNNKKKSNSNLSSSAFPNNS